MTFIDKLKQDLQNVGKLPDDVLKLKVTSVVFRMKEKDIEVKTDVYLTDASKEVLEATFPGCDIDPVDVTNDDEDLGNPLIECITIEKQESQLLVPNIDIYLSPLFSGEEITDEFVRISTAESILFRLVEGFEATLCRVLNLAEIEDMSHRSFAPSIVERLTRDLPRRGLLRSLYYQTRLFEEAMKGKTTLLNMEEENTLIRYVFDIEDDGDRYGINEGRETPGCLPMMKAVYGELSYPLKGLKRETMD